MMIQNYLLIQASDFMQDITLVQHLTHSKLLWHISIPLIGQAAELRHFQLTVKLPALVQPTLSFVELIILEEFKFLCSFGSVNSFSQCCKATKYFYFITLLK
jgi:hypothetical protein